MGNFEILETTVVSQKGTFAFSLWSHIVSPSSGHFWHMGNIGWKKKKVVVPEQPPPPLTTVDEVMGRVEAQERVISGMKAVGVGTKGRWAKILAIINRKIMPTEEQPFPMNLELTLDVLKEILIILFHEVKFINSDGLALARSVIPEMYDKHSLERGSRVSLKEREEKGLKEESYAYGELDHDIFATLFLKIVSVYGYKENGIFYDLGCGVGTLVYTAAFIGYFQKVVGIEVLNTLLERGEKRMVRWEKRKEKFPSRVRNTTIEWIDDDFSINTFWTEGSFIFLHWTAFSTPLKSKVSKYFAGCEEGTQVITFSAPLDLSPHFLLLLTDTCDTSWGKAEFFLHEKITPAEQWE